MLVNFFFCTGDETVDIHPANAGNSQSKVCVVSSSRHDAANQRTQNLTLFKKALFVSKSRDTFLILVILN